MYARASRHYNDQIKSTRPTQIEHVFLNPLVEEYWSINSDVSRQEFSKMMQDKLWETILAYPIDDEALDVMPFGQYKNTPMKDVFLDDPDYLEWVVWTKRNSKGFMSTLCKNVDVAYLMKRLFAIR